MLYLRVVLNPRLGGTLRHIALFLTLFAGCDLESKPAFEDVPASISVEVATTDTDTQDAKEVSASAPVVNDQKDCPSPVVDPEIVRRATNVLKNPSNRSHFIQWKEDHGDDVLGEREGDVQVVFVHKNIRYTIWYPGDMFSIWERPNGTRGQEFIQTYSDQDITGCVNFGIMGSGKSGDDSSRRYMRWNDIGSDLAVAEHHTYWQQRYQMALEALIAQAPSKN